MYIVYHGKSNSIVAAMAAAMHLETLSFYLTQLEHNKSLKRPFNKYFVNSLKEIYYLQQNSLGRLTYMGNDSNGNQVFILNTSYYETIILPALTSVFDILQVPQDQLYLADTTEVKNLFISIGLYLYKYNTFNYLAPRLIFQGLVKEYENLNKIVAKTKIFSQ